MGQPIPCGRKDGPVVADYVDDRADNLAGLSADRGRGDLINLGVEVAVTDQRARRAERALSCQKAVRPASTTVMWW